MQWLAVRGAQWLTHGSKQVGSNEILCVATLHTQSCACIQFCVTLTYGFEIWICITIPLHLYERKF